MKRGAYTSSLKELMILSIRVRPKREITVKITTLHQGISWPLNRYTRDGIIVDFAELVLGRALEANAHD